MNKFPVLNAYRGIANFIGILILIVGFLVSIQVARIGFSNEFNFVPFLGSFLGFASLAGSILIVAEFISLAIRVEDHLDNIRTNDERYQSTTIAILNSKLSELADAMSRMTVAPDSHQEHVAAQESDDTTLLDSTSENIGDETQTIPGKTLHATVLPDRPLGYKRPDVKGGIYRAFKQGQFILLSGRTKDKQWVVCDDGGWVMVDQLDIAGIIDDLPISDAAWK